MPAGNAVQRRRIIRRDCGLQWRRARSYNRVRMSFRRHLSRPAPWLLASMLVLGAPRGSAMAAPLLAAPYYSFVVGGSPFHAASGDLNGDGRPDIVVAT